MDEREQKMTSNMKRKGERQEKERGERRQPSTKRRRHSSCNFIEEDLSWGRCPTQNMDLLMADPWLKPQREVYQAACEKLWKAILTFQSETNFHHEISNGSRFTSSVYEKGSTSQPPQPPHPKPTLVLPTPPILNEAGVNHLNWPSSSLYTEETSQPPQPAFTLDPPDQPTPPISDEFVSNLSWSCSSLYRQETSQPGSWTTVPVLPMPGHTQLGRQSMNNTNIVSSSATTVGGSSQLEVQQEVDGDDNNDNQIRLPADQQLETNPISSTQDVVGNNNRRPPQTDQQSETNEKYFLRGARRRPIIPILIKKYQDMGLIRDSPTELSVQELPVAIPEQTNEHRGTNVNPSMGFFGPQPFSTGQQLRNHQMKANSNFSMGGINGEKRPVMYQQLEATPRNLLQWKNLEGEEAVPTIFSSEQMNAPCSNNQSLIWARTFPTRQHELIYEPTCEGDRLPMGPFLPNLQPTHKASSYNNTGGWNQVSQIQASDILNQGRVSVTEAVASHQSQENLSEIVTAAMAPTQSQGDLSDIVSATMFTAPLQNQDPPANDDVILLQNNQNSQTQPDQGFASSLIEASADLGLPNETIEELVKQLWGDMEEGQQGEIQHLQQEEQPICNEGKIHFESQDHVQDLQEQSFRNINGGDQEAVGTNPPDEEYGFHTERIGIENWRLGSPTTSLIQSFTFQPDGEPNYPFP